jgi:uncharacterized membrane protein
MLDNMIDLPMSLHDIAALFDQMDMVALAGLFLAWLLIGWLIQNPPKSRPSVALLMAEYRREWMRQMVHRNPRIFDAQTLTTLRQGTSFFASAAMLAIGAALAAIGNVDQLIGVASDLSLNNDPRIVFEAKLLVVLFFLTNAFLKFVWSHRLFGYCAVMMGSVPNDPDDPAAIPRALKAAEINITGTRSYNQGLRSIYFALATTAWMIGPLALILATLVTFGVLWRRDFASRSRAIIMAATDGMDHTQSP